MGMFFGEWVCFLENVYVFWRMGMFFWKMGMLFQKMGMFFSENGYVFFRK